MKKYALALSGLALVVMSQSAMAASAGTVTFTGAVSAKTCDLVVESNGVTGANVDVGVAQVNTSGTAVDFVLKQSATNNTDCNALTAADTALIYWSGNLTPDGFANQYAAGTTATGAYVVLKPVNGKTNVAITQTGDSTEFAGNEVKDNGAKYTATLMGKATAGKFSTTATFNVTYM